MEQVIVSGKNQKGKNRIREHGQTWVVLEVRDKVLFDATKGPWLLIAPINKTESHHHRWIHESHDSDMVLLERNVIQ